MYAAIRKYKAKPDSAVELAKRAQEGFVPIVRSLPGFVAYYGIVDDNDTLVTVSLFQDQAAEEESTRRAAVWVKGNLADLVEGPPEIVAGKVAWQGVA